MFDELIRLSGLSPIFATTVLRRVLLRAGIEPEALRRDDLRRILPELERAITVYVGARVAAERVTAIRTTMLGESGSR